MKRLSKIGVAVFVIGCAIPLSAQSGPGAPENAAGADRHILASDAPIAGPEPNTYGTSDYVQVNYEAAAFTPQVDGQWVNQFNTFGWGWWVGGANSTTCTNLHFPSGAIVSGVTTWTEDTDAASGHDIQYAVFDVSFVDSASNQIFFFSTSGAPGIEKLFRPFSTPLVVNNNKRAQMLCIVHGVQGPANRSAGATFWYKLQVSPAPATATFGDEALVAAGVTAGCGGGNYCPDQPITRGQMAVFLASALGLHFPN